MDSFEFFDDQLQPCHVVYTEFRPTPLMHYIYPEGGNGIYLIADEKVATK